ncbi:MAG: ABC transporter permease [Parvularculaceae bacterium]
MTGALTIARDELRYWMRSRLAVSVLAVGLLLTLVSVVLTGARMADAAHERQHLQDEARETFLAQPDRHPHRMVHYGHYVFRAPPPLSAIDPGVDAFTGTSIFLEGHRQNTAMFAERRQSAGLAAFGDLTPAFALQTLAPLLIILVGFASVAREREARTLDLLTAQGVPMLTIVAGKALALAAAAGLTLTPLAIGAFMAGEGFAVTTLFVAGYALYLAVWAVATVLVSAIVTQPNAGLACLLGVWGAIVVLSPRIASSTAASVVDAPGKIETDFAMHAAMKAVGDGHNAADPAFEKLKANLLAQYNVDKVEDLPINFRGVVAGEAEAKLTDVMNEFAERRMTTEMTQANVAKGFAVVSPLLAVRDLSTKLAGVDLETHHRFLREAERVRFDFVQGLNKVHAEGLSFADDVRRSSDPAAEKRTRVSAENWRALEDFRFKPASANARISRAMGPLAILVLWVGLLVGACVVVGRRAA